MGLFCLPSTGRRANWPLRSALGFPKNTIDARSTDLEPPLRQSRAAVLACSRLGENLNAVQLRQADGFHHLQNSLDRSSAEHPAADAGLDRHAVHLARQAPFRPLA